MELFATRITKCGGTFINNENLSPLPAHQCRTRSLDVADEFINVVDRGRDRAPRVQRHACHGKILINGFRVFLIGEAKQYMPPMLEAAIPVLAVTETTSALFACFFLRAVIMALRSKDFPVPARIAPSIQTLMP